MELKEETKKNLDKWKNVYNKLENEIRNVSSPSVLAVLRTYCVSSTPICVHKWMNELRRKLLSACRSVMLPLKFGATALEGIAVLDFLCRQLWVSFIGDAAVRGGRETAVIDNDKHYPPCRMDSFTNFCCKILECRTMNTLLCCYIINISYCILHHTRI